MDILRTIKVIRMTEEFKHDFISEYPYLVQTDAQTLVYTDKADVHYEPDVTVEALTVTENDVYTAPEGKAYSPVTVNVSGGGSTEYNIKCYTYLSDTLTEVTNIVYPVKVVGTTEDDFTTYKYAIDKSNGTISKAQAGKMVAIDFDDLVDGSNDSVYLYEDVSYIQPTETESRVYLRYPADYMTLDDGIVFVMPNHDAGFVEVAE